MQFETQLIQGKILKRYKRFLADIELPTKEIIVAHTANTGSMKTCWEPGWPVQLSFHDNPKRKLKYSLEMIHNSKTWIGINTGLANKLAIESITEQRIPELTGYKLVRPEVSVGKSRLDIKLENHPTQKDCFVEVKNVTLLGENNTALFPDAVSERGQKHLEELMDLKTKGFRCSMFYVVQRMDVNSFSPAKDIDPKYAMLLREAKKAGVEILAYQYEVSETGIKLSKNLKVEL